MTGVTKLGCASYLSDMREVAFALFLFGSYYKFDPRLSIIQENVDITLFFLGLSILMYLCHGIRNGIILRIPKHTFWIVIQFLLLVACLIIGMIYTQSTQYGFDKVMRFAFLTGWAFIGSILIFTDFLSIRRFSWAIIGISTIMAIDSLSGYPGIGEFGFVTALGSNRISLARVSGLGLLTVFAFLLPTERNDWIRLGLWISSVVLLWSMLTTGTRGPVLAFIISILLFLALSIHGFPCIKIDRYSFKFGAMSLFAVIILALISHELFATLVFRTQLAFLGSDPSAGARLDFYYAAFDLLSNSPIWGSGTGQFAIAITGQDIRYYPHNIILELGAENGLIGILFFISLVSLSIREGLIQLFTKRGSSGFVSRYLIAACCFALVNAMVSGDLNDNRILFSFIGLLAVSQRFLFFQKPNVTVSS